ncbi:alpha/beta hydrolase family protein [Geminisphaera colitermitum]|uniref:alpha/beta hydrolase family protein n=1 Tax=Geminisphaera colitermitum TaxID=1148786 RepID=UPI0012FEFFFA|nr:prolyl oligopeptidase family serine peptidase [Geminisphaera colitermitum]
MNPFAKTAALLSTCLCIVVSTTLAESIKLFPSPTPPTQLPRHWNIAELLTPPTTYPVEDPALISTSTDNNITPLFFDNIPYNGNPTRVFAWLGIPSPPPPPSRLATKHPAIVLVHGGGGTAYRDWVKLWNSRGYAAIALDTCGAMPTTADGMHLKTKRHPHSGAPFSGGGFARALDPIQDQWPTHAIAAIIRAHSLLLAHPSVDPQGTGITGISWGGILTEIAATLDPRFKFAAPVYGCAYLGENSFWLETEFQKLPPETIARWISLWDPSQYLGLPSTATPAARTPFLFVNGTNDKHFRPDSWRKTIRLAATTGRPITRTLKIRMSHDHPPAGDPIEITRYANAILRDRPPPPHSSRKPPPPSAGKPPPPRPLFAPNSFTPPTPVPGPPAIGKPHPPPSQRQPTPPPHPSRTTPPLGI